MKIGLYFGSFNPVHHGHLIIGNYVTQHTSVDQVWFVVSPQNPHKKQNSLLNEYHRLYLVQVSVEDEPGLRVSDIEFRLPRPSFTIDTLTYLREKFPSHHFSVVLGSDSYQNLTGWKNYETLIAHYPLIVYERPGFDVKSIYPGSQTTVLEAPLLQISSTHIRENIKKGLSIRYLVPEQVRKEIEENRYYRSMD